MLAIVLLTYRYKLCIPVLYAIHVGNRTLLPVRYRIEYHNRGDSGLRLGWARMFVYLFGWLVGLGWAITCEKGFGDGHRSGMVRTPDYGCWVGGRAGFSTV